MSTQSLVLRHGKLEQRIFFAAVDALAPEDFLSPGETEQAAGFQFDAKKESFLLGRLAAKRALGALLEEPDLKRIEIGSGVYGQPLVRHPRSAAAGVTLSHSHGLAVALAFPAGYPMGIDVETVSEVSAAAILGELEASPAELAWLVSSAVPEQTACCVLWTAREALGKALQTGVNGPLGVLALGEIRAAGESAWAGSYKLFPRCRCLSQARNGRVLSLALPGETEIDAPLRFLDR